MIEGILITFVQNTGMVQKPVRLMFEQGKVAPEVQEAIYQNKAEEEKKKIQPVYNSRGKLVDNRQLGGYLNLTA